MSDVKINELKEEQLKEVNGGSDNNCYVCPNCGYINPKRLACLGCGAPLTSVFKKK